MCIDHFRDVIKRKRDETFKVVWRIQPDHKRLQTRLEHMRKFRQQHEQLQAVIMRVLRPTAQQSQARDDQDQGPVSMSPAPDTSAIEVIYCIYYKLKFLNDKFIISIINTLLIFNSKHLRYVIRK